MSSLEEIQRIYNEFISSAVENEHNDWQTEPNDLIPIIDKLYEALNEYVQEQNNDRP